MMRAQLAAFDHGKLDALPVIPPPGALWRRSSSGCGPRSSSCSRRDSRHHRRLLVFCEYREDNIFWTNFYAQLALFATTWVVFCLADYLPIRQYAVSPTLRNAGIHLGSWSGLLAGWLVSRNWTTLLLWRHRQPFGETDPVFGHDIGFYVFVLPAITTLLGILAAAGIDTAFAFLIARYDQLQAGGHFRRQDVRDGTSSA